MLSSVAICYLPYDKIHYIAWRVKIDTCVCDVNNLIQTPDETFLK